MACGCTDKLNSRDDIKLDDTKKLRLESIQGLSIDEIINLYRDGYRLDGLEDSQYNNVPNIQGHIQEQHINIQNQNSSIKSLYTAYPEIVRVSAHESSVFSGLPYKVSILFRNSGTYGYMRLAVKYGATQIGELKMCRSGMIAPFCYMETIDMSTQDGIVDVYSYACNSGQNCTYPYSCTSETQSGSNTSNAVMLYDTVTLSAPSITTTSLDSSLRLQWTASTGTDVFAYRVIVYQSGNPVFEAYTESSTRDVTVTGLTNGTAYTINISGVNLSAKEGTSGTSTGTPHVITPVLTTITIAPLSASVNVGATVQLTATCRDQNNAIMTCPTITWHTSDSTKATVSPSTGTTTTVTGIAAGTSNITATSGSVTSTAPSVITVTGLPTPVLTTITISPISQSINIGGMVQLTATCRDQNNAIMTCPTITWHTSDSTKATVSPSTGTTTTVTGIAAGTSNITATSGSVTSTAPSVITVTGTVSTLTSISVTPTSASIIVGGTRQLTATCRDQNNVVMACPSLTWDSSDITKATVNSSGLVTGILEGTSNVTASAGIITSNTSVMTVSTTLPQESGGGMVALAVVAIAVAMMMAKK